MLASPYHARAATADALCTELRAAGQPVLGIENWRHDLGRQERHVCGSLMPDFGLAVGRAYNLLVSGPVDWQPDVR